MPIKTLFILNEPAYGNERSYSGLRLARNLAKSGQTELRIFLMGDAVTVAVRGQKVPEGYDNLGIMLRAFGAGSVAIGCCDTCIDARGIEEGSLTEWTLWAEKVLTF